MTTQMVTYKANNQEIKLSEGIVQQFVTKGNGDITQQEAVNFIQLCRYAELNPFLNEAYLIKFGTQPAQMVVGKEAFMKRANRNKNFDGFEAGIVVLHGEEYIKKTGQAIYPNEKLMGGWARVFRKDIGHPTEVEVSLQEFSTGKSTWTKQPANMIRKVALVNALREAFPEDLGALYTEEEPHPTEAQSTVDVMPANEKTEELLADFAAEDIEEIAVETTEEYIVEEVAEDGPANRITKPE